jgi:hypothetical protein
MRSPSQACKQVKEVRCLILLCLGELPKMCMHCIMNDGMVEWRKHRPVPDGRVVLKMENTMKVWICIIGCVICTFGSVSMSAQSLQTMEDSLVASFNVLESSENDESRTAACEDMRRLFIRTFELAGAFDYPFPRLERMTKKHTSDGKVRLLNWNQPNDNGTFRYYAFVLWKKGKDSTLHWQELKQSPRSVDKPESKILTPDKWQGALYYDIFPLYPDKKQNDTYIVLGWEGKDDLSTRKVIDALVFSGDKVKLGAPVFQSEAGARKRHYFEYSNEVSMSLKYFPEKKCIVFDHLSPKSEASKGIYADYGPDGTYDMYRLDKDKFVYMENIDISQFAEGDKKPYYDPRRK